MALILIIDDDEEVRKMLRMTLSQFGHTVIEARNGREGLALYESQGAELIITDLVMPEKEGLEVLMELRNRQPQDHIRPCAGIDAVVGTRQVGSGDLQIEDRLTLGLVLRVHDLLGFVFIGRVKARALRRLGIDAVKLVPPATSST